jgi:hypothetical protein
MRPWRTGRPTLNSRHAELVSASIGSAIEALALALLDPETSSG